MAYTKRASKGTKLEYESSTGPSVYTVIDGVKTFDYPRGSADRIDVTDHSSPDNRKEYIPGLIDPPSFDVPIHWDDKTTTGSATHRAIETAYKAGTSMNLRVTTVDSRTYTFTASVLNIVQNNSTTDGYQNTVTFQPTGAETVGDAA